MDTLFKGLFLSVLMLSSAAFAAISAEELLKRPQAVSAVVTVMPTPDGAKGGVLSVLSAVDEQGRVEAEVLQGDKALWRHVSALPRRDSYTPFNECLFKEDGRGDIQRYCRHIPTYAEHVYLLYGKNDDYKGGLYRKSLYPVEIESEMYVMATVGVKSDGRKSIIRIQGGDMLARSSVRLFVNRSIFLPAIRNGKPMNTQFNVPIDLRIEN